MYVHNYMPWCICTYTHMYMHTYMYTVHIHAHCTCPPLQYIVAQRYWLCVGVIVMSFELQVCHTSHSDANSTGKLLASRVSWPIDLLMYRCSVRSANWPQLVLLRCESAQTTVAHAFVLYTYTYMYSLTGEYIVYQYILTCVYVFIHKHAFLWY